MPRKSPPLAGLTRWMGSGGRIGTSIQPRIHPKSRKTKPACHLLTLAPLCLPYRYFCLRLHLCQRLAPYRYLREFPVAVACVDLADSCTTTLVVFLCGSSSSPFCRIHCGVERDEGVHTIRFAPPEMLSKLSPRPSAPPEYTSASIYTAFPPTTNGFCLR